MIIFDSTSNGAPNGPTRSNRGRVSAVSLPGESLGSVFSLDEWGGFSQLKAIFTQVGFSRGTNHQLQHTLGSRIFLFTFGDRIGQMRLSGFAFEHACEDGDTTQSGLSRVNDFFNRTKLSARSEPLQIALDAVTVFEAYLHDFQCESVSQDGSLRGTYRFTLHLSLIPDDDEQQAGAQGVNINV